MTPFLRRQLQGRPDAVTLEIVNQDHATAVDEGLLASLTEPVIVNLAAVDAGHEVSDVMGATDLGPLTGDKPWRRRRLRREPPLVVCLPTKALPLPVREALEP